MINQQISVILSEDWTGSYPIQESFISEGQVTTVKPARSVAELLNLGHRLISVSQTCRGTTLFYIELKEQGR